MSSIEWCKCISGDAQCGEDISFSTDFEELENEISKMSSLYDRGHTNWARVLEVADHILVSTSKDIRVFGYGVIAVYHQHGLIMFANVLSEYLRFMDEQWDNLYPPVDKPQRRLTAFLWIQSQIKLWKNQAQPNDANLPKSRQAVARALAQLHNFLVEKFVDDSPSFLNLFTEDVVAEAKTPKKSAPKNVEQKTAQTPNTASTPPEDLSPKTMSPMAEVSESAIPKSRQPAVIRDIIDNGRLFATHLLSQNPLDERAYLLHRAAIWGTLVQLPPADNKGKTQLSSGIPRDKLQEYTTSFEDKHYKEILHPLEISTGKSPFWLDGHYMVARCLEELQAENPYQIVKRAFIQLIGRFPSLLSYSFNDGMPFASPAVHEWFEAISQKEVPQKAMLPVEKHGELQENKENDILQEAIALSNEYNFHTGLRHLGSASSGKNRNVFTHGVLQATYCLQLNKKDIALQLLEALYAQLKEWEMLDWEPELTVQILSLLLSCKTKDTTKETIEQRRLLYRLNLDAALNISVSA